MAVEVGDPAVLWVLVVVIVLTWPPRRNRVDLGSAPAGPEPRRGGPARALRSWRGRPRADDAWVADFAEVVSVGLRAGLDLGAAAAAAAGSPGVVDRAPWLGPRLVDRLLVGQGAAVALEVGPSAECPAAGRLLGRTGRPRTSTSSLTGDLRRLAASWRLTEQVGASAAEVTAAAAAAVRAR
ncbi:MAG: hypothetical protein ACRCZP_09885, partial [Phycicoccus sp.]